MGDRPPPIFFTEMGGLACTNTYPKEKEACMQLTGLFGLM